MMPLADILFLAIVVYLLYRFVNNFLLPVVRATRHVREQFRNMQGPAEGEEDKPGQTGNKRSPKPPAEDYIDFEEIK